MSPTPKHLLHFEGGNALSAFRAQALLPKLQSVSARITGVAARHVHWVWTDTEAQPDATRKLASLLRYGDAYEGPTLDAADTALVVVMPRLGTVSPWASKATDIAHNCGLALHRVERVTEFRLTIRTGLLGGIKTLSDEELRAASLLLHDRMTESVAFEREAAEHLFDKQPAEPLVHVDLLGQGRDALVVANAGSAWRCPTMKSTTSSTAFKGLERNPTDVELMMFAQANSEHCRHKIFNASFVIDGRPQDISMFGMIRNTEKLNSQHSIVAYSDNAAVMEGHAIERWVAAHGVVGRGPLRRPRRDRARADEGGDAQPPDGHLAVPGRFHRLRRRDPRRRRHRPRLQAQGRPGRLLGIATCTCRAPASRGSAARWASPSTSPARCRS
jgi:phosphoribosylformylglycinamidine synthase